MLLLLAPSDEIQKAIGRSLTTRRLALGIQTLSPNQVRPLFRAITHQNHITAIMISNNNIRDDSIKYLTESICTMKQLTLLDLSKNNITCEGMKIFLNAFEKATRTICQTLEELDISDNPISNDGFKVVLRLCQCLKLKVLRMNNCRITSDVLETNKTISFDTIETIDVSNNELKNVMVSCLVAGLNPNLIVDLSLDNVGVDGTIVGCIASFMDTAKDLKIRQFGLSSCRLVDGQFMRIFR